MDTVMSARPEAIDIVTNVVTTGVTSLAPPPPSIKASLDDVRKELDTVEEQFAELTEAIEGILTPVHQEEGHPLDGALKDNPNGDSESPLLLEVRALAVRLFDFAAVVRSVLERTQP